MVNKLYANTQKGDLLNFKWGCDKKTSSEVGGCLSLLKLNLRIMSSETYRGNPLYVDSFIP